jgi:transcription-repair coupling factor (superfamily II helicase)
MDIRGAGNLLGEEQSGHIREVGVELYQQMLDEAVSAAKAAARAAETASVAAAPAEGWSPVLQLGMPVLIPERYVSDLDVRMSLYRRAAGLLDEEEIQAFTAELIDRFGPLPEPVENLLTVIRLKRACVAAGVARVDAGPKGVVVGFHNNTFAAPDKLLAFIAREKGTVKLRPDQKVVFLRVLEGREATLKGVRGVLETLKNLL